MQIAGMEEVSVILPVYNRATTVRRAVDSVLTQTYGCFELIVVDDGSTDQTPQILSEITDPRLRRVRLTRNAGAAQARNAGIEAARGNLIAFIDSDDSWRPEKLQRQVAAMRCNPAMELSCTGFGLRRVASGMETERVPGKVGTWFDTLLDHCSVSPGTTLMTNRAVFQEVGLFEPRLRRFEDWDWLLRAVDKYELFIVPEVLADIHVSGYAPPSVVDEAARLLLSLQSARIHERRGARGVARFRSSLEIERAVASIAARRRVSGAGRVLRALLIDPARAARFGRRYLDKLRTRDF